MADYGGGISLSQARDMSHTSDEEDGEQSPRSMQRLSGVGSSRGKASSRRSGGGGGGELVSMGEIIRKPRGRPPGSKNKPKPPIVITRDSDAAMKPVVLEISAGADVVEQVVEYARRRHVGLSIMSGSGTISNVTLRHPMAHAPTISLHGPLHIVSLSGAYVGPTGSSSSSASSPAATPTSPSPPSCSAFSISLAGSQGQVFGGIIAGQVIAQAPVIVVAATFVSPAFHRLPAVPASVTAGDGEGEEAGNHHHHHHCHDEGANKVMEQSRTVASISPMTVYSTNVGAPAAASPSPLNCQISPDVLHWASNTTRPHLF